MQIILQEAGKVSQSTDIRPLLQQQKELEGAVKINESAPNSKATLRKFKAENNQQQIQNFSGPATLKLAEGNKANNLNQAVIQAIRVEYTTWKGMMAHIGYYSNGTMIVTVSGMQQYCYQNGVLIGSSNIWNAEVINGVQCFVHHYPDGSRVCSSDFQQVVLI